MLQKRSDQVNACSWSILTWVPHHKVQYKFNSKYGKKSGGGGGGILFHKFHNYLMKTKWNKVSVSTEKTMKCLDSPCNKRDKWAVFYTFNSVLLMNIREL